MAKLIYPELSYKLTGLFYKIHNNLGRFCTEKQYTDAIDKLLEENKIKYQRENYIRLRFNNNDIMGIFPDFVIEDTIIVDIKAKKFITKEDYNQMQRYLQLLNFKLGLIVNFRNVYLKPKRIINYLYHLYE